MWHAEAHDIVNFHRNEIRRRTTKHALGTLAGLTLNVVPFPFLSASIISFITFFGQGGESYYPYIQVWDKFFFF